MDNPQDLMFLIGFYLLMVLCYSRQASKLFLAFILCVVAIKWSAFSSSDKALANVPTVLGYATK